MRYLFSLFANNVVKGRKIIKEDGTRTDKTSLSIFNFPCYEDTCLNRVAICMILERPLHGNE